LKLPNKRKCYFHANKAIPVNPDDAHEGIVSRIPGFLQGHYRRAFPNKKLESNCPVFF
jgi:hypothetical protein